MIDSHLNHNSKFYFPLLPVLGMALRASYLSSSPIRSAELPELAVILPWNPLKSAKLSTGGMLVTGPVVVDGMWLLGILRLGEGMLLLGVCVGRLWLGMLGLGLWVVALMVLGPFAEGRFSSLIPAGIDGASTKS